MKMLSKIDWVFCDCYLRVARERLEFCQKIIKGKYGTSGIALDIKSALRDIDVALSDASEYKYWTKYKRPPNTPKSRRLGWYPDGGDNNAEK